MTQAILQFTPEKQIPKRKGTLFLDGIQLKPGRNVLENKVFAKLKTHSSFPLLVENEALIVISEKAKVEEKVTLTSMTIKSAEQLIIAEKNVKQLEDWQKEEGAGKKRETVLNLIGRQVNTIKQGQL